MPKTNNFDLIRLAAALQVALTHALGDLGPADGLGLLRMFTDLFPGVPIFFFISGFLISKSFEKNPVLREYALNRLLRIYPALVVCFGVSVASVWLSGYFATTHVAPTSFALWTAAQLSLGQFYNPDFMRQYGIGVLNGSVWTITVELQFYILVPVTYRLLRLRHLPNRRADLLLLTLTIFFMVLNQLYVHAAAAHARPLWYKLAGVSFAPWFYMFLVGMLCQRNFVPLREWLGGRFLPLLLAYVAIGIASTQLAGLGLGNLLNPGFFLALGILTFAAAFSAVTLSERLLRRNDISYGVYLYHGPVINSLLANSARTGLAGSLVALTTTFVLATASWRFIEKPALAWKRHPLYQHRAVAVSS